MSTVLIEAMVCGEFGLRGSGHQVSNSLLADWPDSLPQFFHVEWADSMVVVQGIMEIPEKD